MLLGQQYCLDCTIGRGRVTDYSHDSLPRYKVVCISRTITSTETQQDGLNRYFWTLPSCSVHFVSNLMYFRQFSLLVTFDNTLTCLNHSLTSFQIKVLQDALPFLHFNVKLNVLFLPYLEFMVL